MSKTVFWFSVIIVLIVLLGGFFVFTKTTSNVSQENNQDNLNVGQNNFGDSSGSSQSQSENVKEFDVTAKRYEFIPGTITVNEGDKVILHITSVDVSHGIAISAFGVNEYLPAGQEETVEFIADKKGTYTFFCNVFCGSGHGSMRGTLVVQ